MVDWLYELVIEEQSSGWVPRAEVRAKLDTRLAEMGERMAGSLFTGHPPELTPPDAPNDPEARRDHPSNEQGAKHLMAIAAGGR